jgi:hypothetical protein
VLSIPYSCQREILTPRFFARIIYRAEQSPRLDLFLGEHFRRWAAISAICVGALFLALLALGIGLNRWAQSEGFVDYSEKSRANRAGVFDGGSGMGRLAECSGRSISFCGKGEPILI